MTNYKVSYEGYTAARTHLEYRESDGATRIAPTFTMDDFEVAATGAEEASHKAFDELVNRRVGIVEFVSIRKLPD